MTAEHHTTFNPEVLNDPDVYPWDQGAKVVELQELLIAHGFRLPVNAEFDRFTEAAVKSFQKQHGLRIDGVVGAKTWAVLKTTVQPGTRLLRLGSTGADVHQLQGLLQIHGYLVDRNGIFDAATEQAVKSFQQRSRLKRRGVVDAVTWRFLRGSPFSHAPPKQTRWIVDPRCWW